jgi:ribonuclease HI
MVSPGADRRLGETAPSPYLESVESIESMRSRTASETLTPEEVLRRYTAGPKTGVFSDGSCEGNPGPGGWGVVWVEDDRVVEQQSGTDPSTTNNRMELAALIAAYKMLPEDSRITVYSDSQLCVKTVNEWAAGWEKRGWRRKSGPIANLELVRELYALANAHTGVTLQWIRAHDGSRWNEYADALASAYMLG